MARPVDPGKPSNIFALIIWLRSTMDSISDSDSEDAGSIPAGVTPFLEGNSLSPSAKVKADPSGSII